ncbi:MAG: hypothetical protein R3F34_20035 [Planctomycetota bacterium]
MSTEETVRALPASATVGSIRVVSDLVIPRERAPESASVEVDPSELVTGEGKFGAQGHARRPLSGVAGTGGG